MAHEQTGSARLGLLAGFAAAVAAVAIMVALRLALGVPTVPELLAERFTALIPLPLFDLALSMLGPLAKRLLVGSFFAGQVAVGTLAGLLYLRLGPGLRTATLLSAALAALVLVVIMPLCGAGFFGAGLPAGPAAASAATLSMTAVFGFVLWAVAGLAMPRPVRLPERGDTASAGDLLPAPGPALTRRQFVASAVATVAVVAIGASVLRRSGEANLPVARSATALSAAPGTPTPADLAALPPEVTPIDDFYVVSKNFLVDPQVKVENWTLKVVGPREITLSYDDLLKLESQTQWGTLECISNEVGGDLIGNQSWRGVPLRTLLEMAGIGSDAQRIAIHAEDQYVDSIDIEKALEPNTILAYEMGGAPLTNAHGFPARLIVPNIYGMKNVKWVNKIEPVPADFMGYWQQRGWSQGAVVQTMSRIDLPRSYSKPLPLGPIQIGGIAFAGSRGIQAVEYSTDGGATWSPASVKPPLSPRSWALWAATWTPAAEGEYVLLARAVDGRGEVQTDRVTPPLPDGATGYHTVRVSVRAQA